MAKGVDVPRNTRSAARPKRLIEEAQANGHLVDHSAVVSRGFVAHAPATVDKLQTALEKESGNPQGDDAPLKTFGRFVYENSH